MAAPKPTAPLDVLEQMLNEVLVQTGKALRASVKDGQKRGTLLPANVGKISECNETFNVALDDLEGEIIRAKAVLRRDLEQLRASRRPAPPPIAPPAPMALDLESPEQEAEEPDSLPQLQGESTAPLRAEEAKAMAPFPNMGIDVSPPSASPAPLAVKEEEPSPKPSPKPAGQQFKTASARPSPKPSVAAYTNPAVTPEVKPEPKAAPAPAAAAAAPAPPAASNPAPPPFPDVGSKPPENVSATIIDDAAGAGNGGAEADPELNFTDMQFSLETSLTGDASQQNADGSGFDLTSFPPSDAMGGLDILSLDNYSIGGPPGSTQQQAAAAAKPALAPALAPEPDMDDLFDLGGSSSFDNLNTDLDAGMGGVEGVDSSSFNELFFDDGDTEMGGLGGEFDNAYFGLE